ncbi:MAG TPA: hypothetical protein VL443_29910 [Cyclobacteriaceae bacterium]|jgi:hypothetical protein|nr:hypothetical protein [Cyclobacteriaceae bacterium]
MKKLIYLIFLIPSFLLAQSDADNQTAIDSLKTNTAKKNNATFLWRLFKRENDSKINKDSLLLTTTGTGGSSTLVKTGGKITLNVPVYNSFTLPSNANGVLKNDGSGTLSWSTGGSWNSVSLTNGWTAVSGSTVQWRYSPSGRVELRGIISSSGATGNDITSNGAVPNPQDVTGSLTIRIPVVERTGFSVEYITITSAGKLSIDASIFSTFRQYDLNGVSYLSSF